MKDMLYFQFYFAPLVFARNQRFLILFLLFKLQGIYNKNQNIQIRLEISYYFDVMKDTVKYLFNHNGNPEL